MANVPDYYSILEVPPTATQEEIREGEEENGLAS